MFHYGYKPINNIKKDIANINILKKNIFNLPEPILQTCVKIDQHTYKDSFEISLLRFIHITFGDGNKINMDKLRYLMGDSYVDNELYKFLSYNSKYEKKYIDYNKQFFLKQRTDWCNFLNNRPIFKYKIDNRYQLCSSLGNLFAFFNYFFQFNFKSENDNKTISCLMEFLSFTTQFTGKLYKNGYIGKDKSFEEIIIKIYIENNNLYDWHMYQYYDYNDNIEMTGNSELKYSTYLENFYSVYNYTEDNNLDTSFDSDCSTETFETIPFN